MRHRSGTQLVSHVAPCLCRPAEDEGVHGFTLDAGVRDGMYLAALRKGEGARWIDLAVSNQVGTIALRIWVDLATQSVRSRALEPDAVPDHPALTLGSWLAAVEVRALGYDLEQVTARVVSGDERLWAHLRAASEPLTQRKVCVERDAARGGDSGMKRACDA